MHYPTHQVTGIILAGGRSQRMGYNDKGLMLVHGKPLITYALDQLIPQTSTILINANRLLKKYCAFGYPVISDDTPNYAGPLTGIASTLRHVKTKFALIVPCDCPCFPTTLGHQLMQNLHTQNAMLSVVFDGARLQPLFMLLNKSVLHDLDKHIKSSSNAKVTTWLAKQNHIVTQINATNSHYFININTPTEKQRFTDYISQLTSC